MSRPLQYKHHSTIEFLSNGYGEASEAEGEMFCPTCGALVHFCQYNDATDEYGEQVAFPCPECGAYLALILTLVDIDYPKVRGKAWDPR